MHANDWSCKGGVFITQPNEKKIVGSNLFPHKGISDFIDLIAVVSMAMF
jgi:hypothetical protein